MSEALRQIIAYFGFETDTKKVEEAEKKIASFKDAITGAGQVIAGAFVLNKLSAFIAETEKASLATLAQAQRLEISVNEYEKWEYAAQNAQMTIAEFTTSMKGLNKSIGMALTGNKEAITTFQQLNVQLKGADGKARPALEVMQDMADTMKDMETSKKTALAMKVFLSTGQQMLPMLAEGSENLRKMNEEFDKLGLKMTEQYQQALRKTIPINTKLEKTKKVLSQRIHLQLLPVLNRLRRTYTGLMQTALRLDKNTYFLTTGFVALGAAAGGVAAVGLYKLAKSLGLIKEGLSAIGKIRAIAMLSGGIVLALVAALGLYLLFDSIFTLMKGGESIVGNLLDQFYGAGTAQKFAQGLRDIWQSILEVVEAAKPVVSELMDGLGWALKNVVIPALGAALALQAKMLEYFTKIVSAGLRLVSILGYLSGTKFGEKLSGFAEAAAKLSDKVGGAAGRVADVGTDIASSPFAPPSTLNQGAATTLNDHRSTNVNVNVNAPNADPVKVAQQVGKQVGKNLQNQHALEALNQVSAPSRAGAR